MFDKDGISAAVVMAEMASYLNRQGLTLTEQLHKLYHRFGVLHTCNSCIDWYTSPFLVQNALLGWFWGLPAAKVIRN